MAGYNDPQMQSVLDHIRRYSHSSNNGDPISGKPFFIAEAGVNHLGSLELGERLIREAAEAGAHAITVGCVSKSHPMHNV